MGQFLWSGFDYIGEPTPYHTRNSYFGQIDTAGFPKDSYYVYKAAWTDHKKDPFVHVLPYWDFNPGQMLDVRVISNAPEVELFVNGKSAGLQEIDHKKGKAPFAHWQVEYHKGEIRALAYDAEEKVIAEDMEYVNKLKTTFMPGKKIAAISAAVGAYQNAAKNQMSKK